MRHTANLEVIMEGGSLGFSFEKRGSVMSGLKGQYHKGESVTLGSTHCLGLRSPPFTHLYSLIGLEGGGEAEGEETPSNRGFDY